MRIRDYILHYCWRAISRRVDEMRAVVLQKVFQTFLSLVQKLFLELY